nr:BREX-2 system adenine-specific DNA-methyltransferase PglX [Brachybacterium fresconis]
MTTDARRLVLEVEGDLRAVLAADGEKDSEWRDKHTAALRGNRTSTDFASWRDEHITQVAVSWVLTTVFVRFLEDNGLISPRWFAGHGARRTEATDAEQAYFRAHPEHTAREWILQSIEHLAGLPATAQLVDAKSMLHQIPLSGRMAEQIIAFWRETDDDGELARDFTDENLSTRFLGDLYQDLSEFAKSTYALLQTPEFVEEFILDQTMEPALAERPLDGFRIIDPTCGSGHFLLGVFARLVKRWQKEAPAFNAREIVAKALESVVGVDINPFAVAIARFRLILEALKITGETSLEQAPALEVRIYAGDSLLPWGRGQQTILGDAAGVDGDFIADLAEDREKLHGALRTGQYDAVVGNPPYITVKDPAASKTYRNLYTTTHRQYQLTVPFMERFFALAKTRNGDQPAGWTGQITSNAFMKREFGTKLIEEYLPTKDLRLIVDTSGAYIPGHGTPTLILAGKNQPQQDNSVKAVLGTRGEPGQPKDPAQGLVWRSIVENINSIGFENEFVSVTEPTAKSFAQHPWSLSGGAAPQISDAIQKATTQLLAACIDVVGRTTHTGADDAFFMPAHASKTHGLEHDVVPVVIGEGVRDFSTSPGEVTLFPYGSDGVPVEPSDIASGRYWRCKAILRNQMDFQKTKAERGLRWFDHSMFFPPRYVRPLGIPFAFVATHNHFVLDRGGKVFNRSAPVIKLPAGASEEEHLHLLGVLNSSTALFWLKQNSHNKNTGTGGGGMVDQPWSWMYEFTGTTLQDYPLVEADFTDFGRTMDQLATRHAAAQPSATLRETVPTAEMLSEAAKSSASSRAQMIAAQEELDWFAYRAYGLTEQELTYSGNPPEVQLGERAFEIALARRVAGGTESTEWFDYHHSAPVTEIPAYWPADYRGLVQKRLDLIESSRMIDLLERPEYKRRWLEDPWMKRVDRALRDWLLDRLEDKQIWFDRQGRPVSRSIAQLADVVSRDPELRGVVELWRGSATVDLIKALTDLLTPEVVPYLAAWRLKPKAMEKFRAWQETWQLQRREDAGEIGLDIPVPPKYSSADFRKSTYMALRGKLDVPKERFIHYPNAGLAADGTLQLGWAGWNHFQQYLALAGLMDDMVSDGASDETLRPLVAGLGELLFWVEQWHDEIDPTFGLNAAQFARTDYDQRRAQVGASEDDLLSWRPPAATRGRKARS